MNPRSKRRFILTGSIAGSLVVLAAGGLLARGWYRSEQMAQRRRDGLSAFADRDYEAALPHLSFAARNRSDLEVLVTLAECRKAVPEREQRHLKTAANYFRAALAIDKDNVRALRGLLETYITQGYLAEIPAVTQQILAIDPRDVRALEAQMETRAATGRWAEAAQSARALQEIEPDVLRWRAVELQCLASDGADGDGRLELVRLWRAAQPARGGYALLEADVLRSMGRTSESRAIVVALAQQGVEDRRSLEALLDTLDALGLSNLAESAINASAKVIPDKSALVAIEGDRLMRAGRIDELAAMMALSTTESLETFRLRFSAAYLQGKLAQAKSLVDAQIKGPFAAAPFVIAAAAVLSEDAPRTRVASIEAAAGDQREPMMTVFIADILFGLGELDEAQAALTEGFTRTGRRFQPMGIRAVRTSIALGRIPQALEIARELALRYSSDPSVALAVGEAWASAMSVGFAMSRIDGSFGSDSPEALVKFWTDMGKPQSITALIAQVFINRGQAARAGEVLSAIDANSEQTLLLQTLRLVDRLEAVDRDRVLRVCELRASEPAIAIALAARLSDAGDKAAADVILATALNAATGSERARLELWQRTIAGGTNATASLREELSRVRTAEMAGFVIAQASAWNDESLITDAVKVLAETVGANSVRALVAEASMQMVFHPKDEARIAASIAALDDASRRTADSVSVLTTLSRLLETSSTPDYARALALLQRAVQAQPGAAALYPDVVRLAQEVGDFAVAESAIEIYIQLVGDDLVSRRQVAGFRERQGELDEAAQMHEQLAGRTRATIDKLALARVRQRLGRTDEAEEILKGLIAAQPDALAERELALLYARNGRLVDARAVLDAAELRFIADHPESTHGDDRLTAMRADIELSFGEVANARVLAESLVKHSPNASSELLLARVQLASGEFVLAREALARAIEIDAANPGVLPLAATILLSDPVGRKSMSRALDAARESHPELVAVVEILDAATTADGQIKPTAAMLDDARKLTVRHSSSPLAWRFAIDLYSMAGQSNDAARVALRALSRLPNDTSIAEVATRALIDAGNDDDALAAAAAWKRIGGANAADVESARAAIALRRGDAGQAFTFLQPLAAEIIARPSANAPLNLLIGSAVAAQQTDVALVWLAQLSPARRVIALAAWFEAARSLSPSDRVSALEAVSSFIESPANIANRDGAIAGATPMLIAAWTETCRDGISTACDRAQALLDGADAATLPRELLLADIANARSDFAAAETLYAAIIAPTVQRLGGNFLTAAESLRSDATGAQRATVTGLVFVATNNYAEMLLRNGRDPARALELASLSVAMVPQSGDAVDTWARALQAAGQLDKAVACASTNPDALLGALSNAQVQHQLGQPSSAQASLARAQGLMARGLLQPWSLKERLRATEALIKGKRADE